MTSQQVMLTATATVLSLTVCGLLPGCKADPRTVNALESPYATRRVWAIAPLRNESGSLYADGLRVADHLARHFETASNIDTLAVNRTLAAMQALKLRDFASPGDAQRVLALLQADGLVVGTITAWDPYDPPKMGLALELYTDPRVERAEAVDSRELSAAAAPSENSSAGATTQAGQPVSVVSASFDAADPRVRDYLQSFADQRGPVKRHDDWHRYRISMDLYSDFVSFVMAWRLLEAERSRVTPAATAMTPDATP